MPLQATSYVERRKENTCTAFRSSRSRRLCKMKSDARVQDDGRLRIRGYYLPAIEKHVRVIMLPDEETVLNAFPDSNFTRKRNRL